MLSHIDTCDQYSDLTEYQPDLFLKHFLYKPFIAIVKQRKALFYIVENQKLIAYIFFFLLIYFLPGKDRYLGIRYIKDIASAVLLLLLLLPG